VNRGIQGNQFEPLAHQVKETERLLAALERDAVLQIARETGELVKQLTELKKTVDPNGQREVQAALDELHEEYQLEPPPRAARKRWSKLVARLSSSTSGAVS